MSADTWPMGCRVQDQVAEQLQKMQAALAEAARNLAQSVALAFDPSEVAKTLEKARVASEDLASLGWTLPMRLSPADLVELAGKRSDDVDSFFVGFYSAQDFAELRLVRRDLAGRASLAQWRRLVEQCFDAFERHDHLITVPALLSVLDGVVAKLSRVSSARSINPRKNCADKGAAAGEGIERWMWRSLEVFFSNVFQDAPFDQSRPTLINRHWILHGRDEAAWTPADALRLFNALQTVDSLLE